MFPRPNAQPLIAMRLSTQVFWAASLIITSALIFVWQQPGTIALRNALGGLLLVLVASQFAGVCQISLRRALRQPATKILVVLTLWLALGALVFGVTPWRSMRELVGQWGVSVIFGILGASLGFLATRQQYSRQLVFIIVGSMALQVLLHDALDIWAAIVTGHIPFRAAPVLNAYEIFRTAAPPWYIQKFMIGGHGDLFSYVNNTIACFILAEALQRFLLHKSWLPCPNKILIGLLMAVIFCSYTLQYRNGNVGLLALLLMSIIFLIIKMRHRIGMVKTVIGLVSFMIGVGLLGTVMIKSDPRWKRFADTAIVAVKTNESTSWITHQAPPQLSDGGLVETSAYERIAWIYEGIKLICDNPLGSGYNRNAWGDTLYTNFLKQGLDYKTLQGSHSHSGIVDFTIAAGLPGLLMWIMLLGSLVVSGAQAFNRGNIAPGLVLIFVTISFFGRSLVDSNMRDHMLQQFFFLAGLLLVLSCSPMQLPQAAKRRLARDA